MTIIQPSRQAHGTKPIANRIGSPRWLPAPALFDDHRTFNTNNISLRAIRTTAKVCFQHPPCWSLKCITAYSLLITRLETRQSQWDSPAPEECWSITLKAPFLNVCQLCSFDTLCCPSAGPASHLKGRKYPSYALEQASLIVRLLHSIIAFLQGPQQMWRCSCWAHWGGSLLSIVESHNR